MKYQDGTIIDINIPLEGVCEACDGEGGAADQMVKASCVAVGGYRKMCECCGWVYFTPDHQAMDIKTIGGNCSVCGPKLSGNVRYMGPKDLGIGENLIKKME